jgi:valyl-tRNA synthetase
MLVGEKLLMMSEWPKSEKKFIDAKVQNDFVDLQDLIAKIRNIRASYHIDPIDLIEAYGKVKLEKEIIEKLARVNIVASKGGKEKMIQVSTRNRTLQLNISKSIDVEKEVVAIDKEVKNLENLIAKNEGMLKNKNFVAGAPEEVIEATKSRVREYREKIKIQKELHKNISLI